MFMKEKKEMGNSGCFIYWRFNGDLKLEFLVKNLSALKKCSVIISINQRLKLL